MKLTKVMRKILSEADLSLSQVSGVPMSTAYALESRGLITSAWRQGRTGTSTSGGRFPEYNNVPLTVAGVQAARTIQGLTPLA